MKYSDNGFRPLYKNFCIYPLNNYFRELLKDQKGLDKAQGVMVYGYVDHVAGNMLELLAFTRKEDSEKFSYLMFDDNTSFSIKFSEVIDEEFDFAEYGNSRLYEKFKEKIDSLSKYNDNEDIVKSRSFSFLDEFRYKENFDDVKVILYREGLKLEGVWIKIEMLGKGAILGTLLNDPTQDFGIMSGMPLSFIVNENSDKSKQLIADLTPRQKIKAKDLADGEMLKKAIITFNEDKNKFKLYTVLELLRDSIVVIPYNKKDPSLLSSDNKSFFPVYSSSMEMWQYDDKILKTSMPFIDAVRKARKCKVEGIVVNAFSDSFLVPRTMFQLIEEMDSRIED